MAADAVERVDAVLQRAVDLRAVADLVLRVHRRRVVRGDRALQPGDGDRAWSRVAEIGAASITSLGLGIGVGAHFAGPTSTALPPLVPPPSLPLVKPELGAEAGREVRQAGGLRIRATPAASPAMLPSVVHRRVAGERVFAPPETSMRSCPSTTPTLSVVLIDAAGAQRDRARQVGIAGAVPVYRPVRDRDRTCRRWSCTSASTCSLRWR